MDPDLISEKLESLRRCLQRVQKKCPATPEELMEDPDLQDIISLNLTRAVQLSVDIAVHILADLDVKPPDTMGGTFDALMSAQIIKADLADSRRRTLWPQDRTVSRHSGRFAGNTKRPITRAASHSFRSKVQRVTFRPMACCHAAADAN